MKTLLALAAVVGVGLVSQPREAAAQYHVYRAPTVTYYAPAPRAIFEIVDPDDPLRRVEYGEVGRVMLTTLTKEFFMPRFLERDEGKRAHPIDPYPWDGVTNLGLLTQLSSSVVVVSSSL